MALRLITAPTVEPVSLAEMKADLRVDYSDQDDVISSYITAARIQFERLTGRAFVTQTWEAVFDAFGCREVALDREPVLSVQSVKYDGPDGYEQTLDAGSYDLDNVREPAWVISAGGSWPSTMDAVNAVRIRFEAGYGDPEDVPMPIRQAIKLQVRDWFDPNDKARKTIGGHLEVSLALLSPYRNWF